MKEDGEKGEEEEDGDDVEDCRRSGDDCPSDEVSTGEMSGRVFLSNILGAVSIRLIGTIRSVFAEA